MSCVIALVTDGSVDIVADTGVCDGNILVSTGIPKIKEYDTPFGKMAIGLVGSLPPSQVIFYHFKVPPIDADIPIKSADDYIVKYIIPGIGHLLQDYGIKGLEEYESLSGIIALAGSIYFLDNRLCIVPSVSGYEAVGSARDVALGSLYTTGRIESLKDDGLTRALLALWSARDLTAFVDSGVQHVRIGKNG